MKTRQRLFEILERAEGGDTTSRAVDIFLMTTIIASVTAVVVATVPKIYALSPRGFFVFNTITVFIFTVEYLLRVWVCVERAESGSQRHWLWGRLLYIVSPMALIDLIAILPFFLPYLGVDMRSVRALRLFRMLRIFKFGRYSSGVRIMLSVLRDRKAELIAALGMLLAILFLSSSVVYYAERQHQIEAFSSIPAAMWWAIATLTTVGYGDVYPITPMGQVFGAVTAISGLLLVALPTGILGAGFVEAFEAERRKEHADLGICPTCGRELTHGGHLSRPA